MCRRFARAGRQLPNQMLAAVYQTVNPATTVCPRLRSQTLPLSTVNEYANRPFAAISRVNGVAGNYSRAKYAAESTWTRESSRLGIGSDEVVNAIQSRTSPTDRTMYGRSAVHRARRGQLLKACLGS